MKSGKLLIKKLRKTLQKNKFKIKIYDLTTSFRPLCVCKELSTASIGK